MNTGGPASEKTLLDEFAGRALAAMVEAESKESHKQLTNDGYGSEATYFTRGFADEDYWDGAAKASYACAAAMLAEKARREAVVQESSTTESYITDKNGIPVARVTHAPISDHSPDATKMIELEAANRELVEALEAMVAHHTPCHWVDTSGDQYRHLNQARTALSKHKGAA